MTMRRVIGCMTGTSIDGIDCALVEIDGRGLDMRARFVRGHSAPPGAPAPRLRALASGEAMTAREIAALSREFAFLHVEAIQGLIASGGATDGSPAGADSDAAPIALICVHGQTVYHAPPLSWQLLNPAPIAHALRIPVVFDLRAADVAAGGQGAPVTPIADWILFRHSTERRAIVNLGGFCNATVLPSGTAGTPAGIAGFDICACNQLLDAIARTRLDRPFDSDGAAAAAGSIDPRAFEVLADLLGRQSRAGRSLGTGDELADVLDALGDTRPSDLARSACEAIARVAAARLPSIDRVLVAGGGTNHPVLVHAIARHAGVPVERTDGHGVPVEYREAACFAVLGALCEDRVPITLPQVTGVPTPAPIAGCWIRP